MESGESDRQRVPGDPLRMGLDIIEDQAEGGGRRKSVAKLHKLGFAQTARICSSLGTQLRFVLAGFPVAFLLAERRQGGLRGGLPAQPCACHRAGERDVARLSGEHQMAAGHRPRQRIARQSGAGNRVRV